MKEKPEKTGKRKNPDTRFQRFLRRAVIIVITLVLLALAAFHLFALITGNDELRKPEAAVAGVVTPIQSGFSTVVDWVVDYLYKVKLRSSIEIAYNELRQENEQLVYRAMLADELQKKLTVYETLFNEISVNESMNPLIANVIGREAGNYFSVFTLNKGSNDGVDDFMAVTMGGALVGYTYNVSPTKSLVRTIIDSEASIAGLISSTRDQGTVRGTLGIDGTAMCRMYYLPEENLPRPGDEVVTSGVGMSFPKGIPIGTVRESTRGMESNKQFIVLEPKADFQHIEYVIVLRYQPDPEPVQGRAGSDTNLTFSDLDPIQPVPTIQIGNDFYQLAPTPTPAPDESPSPDETATDGNELTTPTPTNPPDDGGGLEYQRPAGQETAGSYGFTIEPTATPSPTPPPLDISVEED